MQKYFVKFSFVFCHFIFFDDFYTIFYTLTLQFFKK